MDLAAASPLVVSDGQDQLSARMLMGSTLVGLACLRKGSTASTIGRSVPVSMRRPSSIN